MNREEYEKKGKSAVESFVNSFGNFFNGLGGFGKDFIHITGNYFHELNESLKNNFKRKDQ